MNPELVNIYIEKLILNLTELTKTNVLQAAQLELIIRMNGELNKKVAEIEAALDKANSKTKKSNSDF